MLYALAAAYCMKKTKTPATAVKHETSLVSSYRVLPGEAYDLIKTRHFSPYHLLSTIKSKPESLFLPGVNGMNCWQKLAADPYSVTGQPCVTFFLVRL
jgi:hypothetical protein